MYQIIDSFVNLAFKVYIWARREHFDVRILNEWQSTLEELIVNRINVLKRKKKVWKTQQILRRNKHLEYLKQFQQQYVLVPADKASNNILVVCKKYYVDVLVKELLNAGQPSTYVDGGDTYDRLVKKHVCDLKRWNIRIPPVMEELPTLYWMPKLHKNPFGSRFIAASNKCTTKPLSTLLTTCLTALLVHFEEYCAGICRNTGINCFWVINNAQSVLHSLYTLNCTLDGRSLDTFDFSTLYTSIPHHSLKLTIKSLIEEAFRVRGALYICITRRGKWFWSTDCNHNINITRTQLVDMVDYLIDNIFVCVSNKVFKQSIGIPMGTDCAPLLANLYLFYFEYKFMKNLMKNNLAKARSFTYSFRYIDDLLTINNPSFEDNVKEIYPPELVLKKTTESKNLCSYLDVGISIVNGHFNTTVYDKRDDFNFRIVNFPFLSSNIPAGPSYGIYISQLVRIGRICNTYDEFVKRHLMITGRLIKQGFRYSKLVKSFKKFYIKYIHLMDNYNVCLKRHISEGICPLYIGLPVLFKHVTTRKP